MLNKTLKDGRIAEEDWKVLFPGKTHMLGGQIPLYLEPAGIGKIQFIASRLMEITGILEQVGIDLKNLEKPEQLSMALPVIVQYIPDVIGELSGLHQDDVARLPLSALMPLAMDIMEVNKASLEYLQKNLQSLAMILVAIRNMGLGT